MKKINTFISNKKMFDDINQKLFNSNVMELSKNNETEIVELNLEKNKN